MKTVIDFVEKHRISVLTTLLPNGNPHSATLHYASSNSPLKFIFFTDKGTRKLKGLEAGKSSSAFLVIGFSEEEWVTLQMEGNVTWLKDKNKLEEAWKIYSEKYLGSDKYKNGQDSVILSFTPTWWRYTEFRPKPPKIIGSK